ncbi:FKBP-type peptidyl-prolyl cis-trans isomerase [Haliscomenobacter hydrossis]|uniref:Peptidyl-prolyl cis-trans isomerase n=1 Tax=Haliscomenobacter hydrossis (strain ATCC 27775 / DSM 1100 / LMG 10767 / O) TaxID=760192 RepID=F4KRN0_HALH1|nr:FKBP-type peptidyl-prolyl cis-trans isomerase [Haliscomenobacter hydrossis]AEE49019.1 peptidylprolyl isomerase FKBP-type [Haliscomenobacter hydrossis DSM 1100]
MRQKMLCFFLLLSLILPSACVNLNSKEEERLEEQLATIEKYISDKGLSAVKDPAGMYYISTVEGTGKSIRFDSVQLVTFNYRGYLLDGTEFDKSDAGKPITTSLQGLIPGFQVGIAKMKKGGKATFIIPSALAYGSNPPSGIPANAIVLFDVELVDFGTQAEFDDTVIQKYLLDNSLTAEKHSSGLYYIISEPGTGENPSSSSIVTVKYKGYFTDKKVFDETKADATAQFPLTNLIEGWKIAIPLLKKGGKGTFLIPSRLGYGPSGSAGGVPGNSVIIFDIELVSF